MQDELNGEFQKVLESDEIIEKIKSWDRSLGTLYNWPIQKQLISLKKNCLPQAEWLDDLIGDSDQEVADKIFSKTLRMREELCRVLSDPRCDNREQLAEWIIQEWGGIKSGNDLSKIIEKAEQEKEGKKFSFGRIASWSKYMAFKYPKEYGVYDARVAFSINWLLFTINSRTYFPFLDGQNAILNLLDFRMRIFLQRNRDQVAEIFRQDIQKRGKPGGRSELKGKLGAGVFLDEKNAYWQYSLLLKALARKVCPDDMQHGVTRMEMILFSIADRHIAQEIVDSMIAQHG